MRHPKEGRKGKGRVPTTSKIRDKIGESISIGTELNLKHFYWSCS